MAKIRPMIYAELDPSCPVQEICDVISVMLIHHPQQQEQILNGLQDAIDRKRKEIAKQKEARKKDSA